MRVWAGFTALAALAAFIPGRAMAQEGTPNSSPAARARLRMVIDAEIYEKLGELADKKKTETVRCLMGAREGETLNINVAYEPKVDRSTENDVRYDACPSGTIALWHTHRPIKGIAPEFSCYLSAVDVQAAMAPGAPPVQIVQVRSDVMCWWIPRDFQGVVAASVMFPKQNQRTGMAVDLASADCTGPARILPFCGSRRDAIAVAAAESNAARVSSLLRISAAPPPSLP